MEVAFTLDFRNPTRRPWRELWEDNLWLMREAEAMGFDALLVQEHFATADGYGPSVPVFITSLAERTKTCRLGSYLYILPIHNPIALAQETAVLDQFCGGRLDVVVGAGHRAQEFRIFGVPEKTRPSRMEEHLEVLKLAWTQRPMSYQGRYYDLTDVEVYPEPLQIPHPPLWVGATRPAAAERAGRHGAWLAAASEEPEVFEAYFRGLVSAGVSPGAAQVSKSWSITTTFEEPETMWERYADLHHERWDFYRRIRSEFGDPDLALSLAPERGDYRRNELVGAPDDVLAALTEAAARMPLTRLVHSCTAGIPVREVLYPSLKLFAEQVMPALKSLTSRSAVAGPA
jgi:alkanesulfonate monooxygenase SsuD/methylene tetrahydromethanopterin reductase-like flavin-dependent oxidoreductase (luciferase family)